MLEYVIFSCKPVQQQRVQQKTKFGKRVPWKGADDAQTLITRIVRAQHRETYNTTLDNEKSKVHRDWEHPVRLTAQETHVVTTLCNRLKLSLRTSVTTSDVTCVQRHRWRSLDTTG